MHAEELGHEDRGDGRVDRGAAVHLGGRAERHREGGVGARDAQVPFGHALGQRQGADRGAGDEGQLDGRPDAGEELPRDSPWRAEHRVDHEQHQGQADVDRDDELAERADGVPAVDGHGVADQADGADRGEPDDPPEDLLDDGEGGGVEDRNGSAALPTLSAAMPTAIAITSSWSTLKLTAGAPVVRRARQAQEVRGDQPGEEGPPATGLAVVFGLLAGCRAVAPG